MVVKAVDDRRVALDAGIQRAPAGDPQHFLRLGQIGFHGEGQLQNRIPRRVAPAAEKLVDGLIDHCCDWSEDRCGVLTHCTASYHDDGAGRHTNITYGDYFFVEAIAKLCGTDPMLWL